MDAYVCLKPLTVDVEAAGEESSSEDEDDDDTDSDEDGGSADGEDEDVTLVAPITTVTDEDAVEEPEEEVSTRTAVIPPWSLSRLHRNLA